MMWRLTENKPILEFKDEKENAKTEMETNLARIDNYLAQKKSMKFCTINGTSFLRYAILSNNEKLAIRIVQNGIDVAINEPWPNGQSPLHLACSCQLDMVNLIAAIFKYKVKELNLYSITDDHLVSINNFQSGGKTILHYAAINGSLETCKLIMQFEKNHPTNKLLFIKDFDDNTAIDAAVIHRKYEVAKYLLSLQNKAESEINEWIKVRENKWLQTHHTIDVITRLRIQQLNKEATLSEDDPLNQAFVLNQIWNKDVCKSILDKVIKYGDKCGWTTTRHRNYATTDIPSHCVGPELDEYVRKMLYKTLYPLIIEKYALNERLGADVEKGQFVEIGIRDLFFVKYDMLQQRELKLHRDGSLVSFNILLNDRSEFDGGGTYFKKIDKVIEIEKGDAAIHCGQILHAGHPITKGIRYILVGFLDAKVMMKK